MLNMFLSMYRPPLFLRGDTCGKQLVSQAKWKGGCFFPAIVIFLETVAIALSSSNASGAMREREEGNHETAINHS
jgi:hypothetical protein